MSRFKFLRDILDGDSLTMLTGTDVTVDLGFLANEAIDGFFSLQLITTGAGALQAEWLVSNEKVAASFVVPYISNGSAMADIVSAHAAGTGVYSFAPPVAAFNKIKFTATGAVVITRANLCIK